MTAQPLAYGVMRVCGGCHGKIWVRQHVPELKEEKYTFKAKIRPLSDFMGIK